MHFGEEVKSLLAVANLNKHSTSTGTHPHKAVAGWPH